MRKHLVRLIGHAPLLALLAAMPAEAGTFRLLGMQEATIADILAAFQRRLGNDLDAETKTALAEIDRIAALRLKDILP